MTAFIPPTFQTHWSPVPPKDAEGLALPGGRLLAIWPAPVNHDTCFEEAGFTFFGDNDQDWDEAAEEILQRVVESLVRFGAVKLISKPLRNDPPWYFRLFRTGRELPLLQQALLPMEWDSLPSFHARFGKGGAALWTGNGHFLLWVSLPSDGPDEAEFVASVAGLSPVVQTRLRWAALLTR